MNSAWNQKLNKCYLKNNKNNNASKNNDYNENENENDSDSDSDYNSDFYRILNNEDLDDDVPIESLLDLSKLRELRLKEYSNSIVDDKKYHYCLKYRREYQQTRHLEKLKKKISEKESIQEKNIADESLIDAETAAADDDETEPTYECAFSEEETIDSDLLEINKKVKKIVNESLNKAGSILSPPRKKRLLYGLQEQFQKQLPIVDCVKKLNVSQSNDTAKSSHENYENESSRLDVIPINEQTFDPYFFDIESDEIEQNNNEKLKKLDVVLDSKNVEDKVIDTESIILEDTENQTNDSELIISEDVEDQNKDVESITSKKKQKTKVQENFRKLNIKKKNFSRGYKRFNIKKYKRQSFVKSKKDAKLEKNCSKCGSDLHQEEECDNLDISNDQEYAGNKRPSDNESPLKIGIRKPYFYHVDDRKLDKLVEKSLKDFGLKDFRPNQKLVVKRILCGKSTLLISPTGFGKSLCYQLASYCYWTGKKYITIVVSPLISLMQDQLKNLPKCLKAVCYNSSQTNAENNQAINDIIESRAQILFLSPEFLVCGFNKINFCNFPRVAFVCIDEAHCIAEWSTNFRPAYLQFFKILKERLDIRIVLAMTATATKETAKTICNNLKLSSEKDVIGQTAIPDNLVLTVSTTENKLIDLVSILKKEPYFGLDSIIVYCTKRDETESIASYIRTSLQFEKNFKDYELFAEAYHAGLSTQQRNRIQKKFINGKLRIVVATIAFGMGINKSNVRGIIHYNMPKSFENYVQEIGRAGRDGQKSYCHLLLNQNGEDLFTLQSFIYGNSFDKNDLTKFVKKVYEPCNCRLKAETLNEELKTCAHSVALPVAKIESITDIKSEVLNTILFCMEKLEKFPIKLLQPFNSTCSIRFSCDLDEAKKIVEGETTLTIIDAFVKRKRRCHSVMNFQFNIAEIARLFRKDSMSTRNNIKEIEWNINRKFRDRCIHVSFSDYSFHFESPGILLEQDIQQVVNELYEIMLLNEKKEIMKLRFVYSKFREFVLNGPKIQNRSSFYEVSDELKAFLNDYFQSDNYDWRKIKQSELILPSRLDPENIEYAVTTCQIQRLFEMYGEENDLNTPRKLARILQGISSPKYSAEFWGKVYRFWRLFPNMDFNYLMELCHECMTD